MRFTSDSSVVNSGFEIYYSGTKRIFTILNLLMFIAIFLRLYGVFP